MRQERTRSVAGAAAPGRDGGQGQPDREKLGGSLQHGLAILEAFSAEQPVLGVGDLARKLGTHKSTVSRVAVTLEAAGYLERAGERGRYRLGFTLARLGGLVGAGGDLRRVARPTLNNLVSDLGETAHLGVLEGAEAVTIDLVDGWHTVRMHSAVGKRSPAHCSSIGKAMLAGLTAADVQARLPAALPARTGRTITDHTALAEHLHELRQRGWSVDDEELEPGLCCVGAPVFDEDGRIVAAISVSGPTSRVNAGTHEAVGRRVRAAAAEISARLGAPAERRTWPAGPPGMFTATGG